MTSGQDVSEYLDTLGLAKPYLSSFWGKKIKKSIFFLVLQHPRGSGDLPVCRIACYP
jgi:hypothetical protein